MSLSLRHLKIFVALAQSLNFSRTAEQSNVAQPRLSKIIREIEDSLEVRLFERNTRRVALTPDGEALLPVARKMVEAYESGLSEIQEVTQRKSQRLALAALPTLAGTVLPGLIASLRAAHPTLSIKLHDVPGVACIELLRARKVDIALTSIDDAPADLERLPALDDPFVMLSARGSPLPWKETPVWSDAPFGSLPLICSPRGTSFRRAIDASFLRDDIELPEMLEVEQLAGMAKFIKAGCGYALLPYLAAEIVLDDTLVITHFRHAPTRSLGVVLRSGEERHPLVQVVIDSVLRFARERRLPAAA